MKATIVMLLCATLTACADPGPPIPLPVQDVAEATALARSKFLSLAGTASETNQMQQCIAIRVAYEPPSMFTHIHKGMLGKKASALLTDHDWTWFITFVHPIENDAPVILRVLRNGKVALIVPDRWK